MTSIWSNYINVSDYLDNVKNMFLYEITHRYVKNDYQIFYTLKTEDRKIRGNCQFINKSQIS